MVGSLVSWCFIASEQCVGTYYRSTHGCNRVLSFSLTAALLEDAPLALLAAAAAARALLLKKLAIF